jgi:hypothetical protein
VGVTSASANSTNCTGGVTCASACTGSKLGTRSHRGGSELVGRHESGDSEKIETHADHCDSMALNVGCDAGNVASAVAGVLAVLERLGLESALESRLGEVRVSAWAEVWFGSEHEHR